MYLLTFLQSLTFRRSSKQLFSGSYDRTVKLFDLSVMGYVETLFGHQDFVMSIDSLRGEAAVTCGGRDRTVRYWKVVDETQLVFRGGGQSKLRDLLEGGALAGVDADDGDKSKEKEQKTYVEGSMEVVCMVDETTFLSGGDSGYAFSSVFLIFVPTKTITGRYLFGRHRRKSQYTFRQLHMGFTRLCVKNGGRLRLLGG